MFAEVLHIRPWETGLLELGEFYGLCDYIDRRAEAERKAVGGTTSGSDQVTIGRGSDPSDLNVTREGVR